jgi:hypothetical protein
LGRAVKEKKTAIQLAEMIRSRLSGAAIAVRVVDDPVHGWNANVMALPEHFAVAQSRAKEIAAELRHRYDLQGETSPQLLMRHLKWTRKAG